MFSDSRGKLAQDDHHRKPHERAPRGHRAFFDLRTERPARPSVLPAETGLSHVRRLLTLFLPHVADRARAERPTTSSVYSSALIAPCLLVSDDVMTLCCSATLET